MVAFAPKSAIAGQAPELYGACDLCGTVDDLWLYHHHIVGLKQCCRLCWNTWIDSLGVRAFDPMYADEAKGGVA